MRRAIRSGLRLPPTPKADINGCLGRSIYADTTLIGIAVPTEQFTGEGGFFLGMLSDGSKTFFLSAGISALAGYETVNGGKKLLFDGSTLRDKDGFLYGGAVTLQAETCLTDKLVLLFYGRERCLWGGSTEHFHAQYGVGLKIMLD